MPRQARQKGEFSTYHVIQRGNEKKNIFLSDTDRVRFLETLARMKEKYGFHIYAYCLMDNHVHLVINDNGKDISQLMKSINISYAYYFNKTYRRCGHLFQDRFRSELIDNDTYLLEVSKYIHNNPVKAGMVKKPEEYIWSSYNIYSGKSKDIMDLVDKYKILDSLSSNRNMAIKKYVYYVLKQGETPFNILEVNEHSDEAGENHISFSSITEANKKLEEMLDRKGLKYIDMLQQITERDALIKEMRKYTTLTLKDIGKLFGGLSESRISRILGK